MHGHRHPTRTDVISQYRRDALLRAAIHVFGEHGFDCATMEGIAQEADVAKGTTYLYYSSKQSIYDAALSHGLAELDDRTRQAIEQAASLREAISAFVSARTRYFLEHRDFFRMYALAMARQVTSRRPRAWEVQAIVDRQTRRLEKAIARAVARHEIRKVDAASTALAIFDLTRGLVSRGVMSDDTFDVDREVAFVSAFVWQGIEPERGHGSRGGAPRAARRDSGKRGPAARGRSQKRDRAT